MMKDFKLVQNMYDLIERQYYYEHHEHFENADITSDEFKMFQIEYPASFAVAMKLFLERKTKEIDSLIDKPAC